MCWADPPSDRPALRRGAARVHSPLWCHARTPSPTELGKDKAQEEWPRCTFRRRERELHQTRRPAIHATSCSIFFASREPMRSLFYLLAQSFLDEFKLILWLEFSPFYSTYLVLVYVCTVNLHLCSILYWVQPVSHSTLMSAVYSKVNTILYTVLVVYTFHIDHHLWNAFSNLAIQYTCRSILAVYLP